MKRIFLLLVITLAGLISAPALAQVVLDKEPIELIVDESGEEKSKLTEAEHEDLIERTTRLRALVGTIEASSTSRKEVKFAKADLAELQGLLDTYIKEKKLVGPPAEKMPNVASSMAETLRTMNARLKAGETDDVEDALPKLRTQATRLKDLAAKIVNE
jgi:hypothetical protein